VLLGKVHGVVVHAIAYVVSPSRFASLRAKRSNPENKQYHFLDCFVTSFLAMTQSDDKSRVPKFHIH